VEKLRRKLAIFCRANYTRAHWTAIPLIHPCPELAMPTKDDFPAILTKKDWNKNIGKFAKITEGNGVGDALDLLEQSYKHVNWKIFNPYLALPTDREAQTKEGLVMVIKNAQAEIKINLRGGLTPNIKNVRNEVTKAKKHFEKSKLVPKKAGEHAANVLDALTKLEADTDENKLVEDLKKGVAQKQKDFAEWDKMQAGMKDKFKAYVLAVGKDMKTVKTKDQFMFCWKENIRGVGTMLPNFAKQLGLEEQHKQWKTFASQGFLPTKDEEIPGKFNQMRPVLREIASKLV
jgi:hypothetical protein